LRIWAPEGYAGIDFVSRKLVLVQASDELRRTGIRVDKMDPATKARLKDDVFGRYLQTQTLDGDRKWDQLTAELRHFVDCVRYGRTPRVTGEAGRDALSLAERVLEAVKAHRWDGTAGGPVGPIRTPRPAGRLFETPAPPAAARREAA
jgi:hypothetical protein